MIVSTHIYYNISQNFHVSHFGGDHPACIISKARSLRMKSTEKIRRQLRVSSRNGGSQCQYLITQSVLQVDKTEERAA